MAHRRVFPFLALLALLVSTGFAAVALAPGAAFATDDRAATGADRALDRAMSAFVKHEGASPGIAVVVQRGRRPVLHSAGTAVLGTETPPKIADHVRVASVAKAYSGAAAPVPPRVVGTAGARAQLGGPLAVPVPDAVRNRVRTLR